MDKYVIDLDKVLDELELNDKYDESNNYDPNDSKHDPNADVSSAHFNDSIVSLMNLNEKIDMKDADFSIHVKPPKLLTNINNNDNSINNFHAGNMNILIKHNNDNNGNIQNVDNVQQQQQPNSDLSNDLSSLSNLIRTTTTTTTTTSHDNFIDAKNTDVTINQQFSSTNDDHMQNNQSNVEFSYVHNNNNSNSSSKQTSVIEDVSSNNNISIVSDSQEASNVDDDNTNTNTNYNVIIQEDKCDIDADQLVDNKTVVSDVPDEKSCDNLNEIVKDSTNLDLNDDERPQESIIIAKTCAFIEENQPTANNVDLELNDDENQTISISQPEIPTETSISQTESDDVLEEKNEIIKDDGNHLDEDTIGNMNEEDLDKYLGDLNNDLENLELQTEKIIGNPGEKVTEPTAVCHQIVEQNCVNNSEQTKTLLAVTNTSNGMQTVNDDEENFEQIETAVPIDTVDAQFEHEQNETCGSSNEPIIANENNDTDAQLKELEELLTAAYASNNNNNNNNNNQNSENRGGLVQNITYFERQEMPHGLTEEEQMLGKVKPFWIPDEDAQNCLHCDVKFTMIKRRHHCRSCGKVLCSQCCNFKAKLPYLEYKEARVCQLCYGILMRIEEIERINGHQIDISNAISNLNQSLEARSNSHHNHNNNNNNVTIPDPNNPSEYCSTIPPLEQVNEAVQLPPPTVMVPIGVLKRPGTSNMRRPNTSPESSNGERAETVKQVMFSDGVRPGGDLVEPQPSTARLPADEQKPMIRTQLQLKSPLAEKILVPFENITKRMKMTRLTVVDNNGVSLPPIINYNELKSVDPSLPSKPNYQQLVELLKNPLMPCVTFGLTKNLHINAKIISKTCCNSKECWSFFSKGLASSGQDEILLVLDCESLKRSSTVPDAQPQQQQTSDKNPTQDDLQSDPVILDNYDFPRDVFRLYTTIYDSASSATLYLDLTHIFFPDGLFNNKENSGFIFTRPTLQCFQNINVPAPPFLIAILIHKWEIPWAKVFPLRLVLRLGYEYKMYPSPVISYANRKSTYFEIGHTIMNVLADFRNFHYTLSVVKDLFICVEDRKRVNLLIPKLSYEKVCKVLSTSNEHVLAFGGNLSLKCDSHFVCIQNEDEDDSQYHTQLFSYPDSPQKLTGASFIVFSGALKSSTGLKAKMNIVEDGLLVQIPPTMMEELRSAIKDMKDLKIDCCKVTENDSPVEAYVHLQWVNDELSTNLGVRSQIDGLNLEGVQSARIFSNPDYANERYLIRWIEVFLLQINENSRRSEMINANRLAESVAQAFCVALIDYLDQLYENGLTKISLRISLDVDKVGYETGSGGKPLPTQITQPLDNALIPVIMENISTTGIEDPLVIELLFFVLLK